MGYIEPYKPKDRYDWVDEPAGIAGFRRRWAYIGTW